MNSVEFIKKAQELKGMGFSVIPLYGYNDESVDVKIRGKRPIPKGWEEFCTRFATDREIEAWAKSKEELNIGIACGMASNLTVVDADSEEAVRFLEENGIPETLKVKTRKGYHYYFKYCNNPNVSNRVRVFEDIDIRTQGGQVVAPGSTHQTGFTYQWENMVADIAEFPSWIEERFNALADESKSAKSSTEAFDATKVREGSRNATLISKAGSIFKSTGSKEAVQAVVKMLNEQFQEPLPDSEIETIVNSACRYDRPSVIHKLTDIGVSERFIDKYGDKVCFNADSGNWMVYDGAMWKEIQTDSKMMTCAPLMDMYMGIVRNMPNEVPEDSEYREAFEDAAHKYENFSYEKKVMSRTAGVLSKSVNDFDKDDYLLNCKNVTLDLHNHKVREHSHTDYLATTIPVTYDSSATCPLWDSFLDKIMGGNTELIQYLQKAVGYSLTGSTEEQVFFILYGGGANGKSVFLDLIAYMMGGYGHQAAFSTFLTKMNDAGGNARSDIASMKSARLVVASESGYAKTLDDAIIKDITGGKNISARFLYKNDFTFTPKMKIWLTTNHKPNIVDNSNGMWRRVKLIPFNVTIPTDEQDKTLYFKLLKELPGILNWALEGLKMWQKDGLGYCKPVDDEVNEYKKDSDIIAQFVEECLDVCEDSVTEKSSIIYEKFKEWYSVNVNAGKTPANNVFSVRLTDKGYKKEHSRAGTVWRGICVRSEY